MAKALKKGGLAGQPPLRFVHPDYTSVSLAKRPVDNVHGRRRTDHDFDGVESRPGASYHA